MTFKENTLGQLAKLYQPQTIGSKLFTTHGYPVYGANGKIGTFGKYNHEKWQIVISCRGNCGTVNKTEPYSWINGNAMVVNFDDNPNVDKHFFYHALSGADFSDLVTGSGQPQIVRGPLENFVIKYPPSLAEQQKIAAVLSDIDALIETQEALIAKKKDVKAATMELLLTGKKRLPGFVAKWHEKSLGDVCSIKTGKKDVNEGDLKGEYPFFTCSKKHTYSASYSFDTEAILVAGNGDVGNLSYYQGKFEAYQRTYVLSSFNVNVEFLWQSLLSRLGKELGLGKVGSTIPYIKIEQLQNFSFSYPADVLEIQAISQILANYDQVLMAEVKLLEKLMFTKSSVMHKLLTGEIRLP